jgi:hypothetical protein
MAQLKPRGCHSSFQDAKIRFIQQRQLEVVVYHQELDDFGRMLPGYPVCLYYAYQKSRVAVRVSRLIRLVPRHIQYNFIIYKFLLNKPCNIPASEVAWMRCGGIWGFMASTFPDSATLYAV